MAMKLLLHICCANCAIYPVNILREAGHNVTGYFFNHNIHPYQEFLRRMNTVREYAAECALPVIYQEAYLLEDFLTEVAREPAGRCTYCYQFRLKETAAYAAANGYEGFTSSLLYSRYQNHDLIRQFGEELARHYQLEFVYADFRIGWQAGILASKQLGLYRQQYCGCIYSEKDRYYPGNNN